MRLLVFLSFLCLLPLTAQAADAVSGDEIKLGDGRVVRLLGIKAASEGAKAQLQSLIDQRSLAVEGDTIDRYGRVAADVYLTLAKGDKLWLQGEMLRQGLAFVYPPEGSEPHLPDLLKFEREARAAKRGIWNDPAYADKPASDPRMGYGQFAFVRGKVVKAERIKNMVYLNFGADWHEDFTAAIAAHDLHTFRDADIDPLTYEGKTIRVRGWIKRDFGPMITVTHPAQIEILTEK